jgi:uncharacterized protein (TIGR02217 family)
MAFHDVRLKEDVERGAQGGPRFKTTVLTLSSGFERRNIDWANTRSEYDVGYGIMTKADLDDVREFFYARQGKAHSFRFKDWADFEITAQSVGTTDTTTSTFQLFKRYTSGGINHDRTLTKPVASGWVVTVNAVSQTVVYDTSPGATQVAINTTTGIITLGSTHAATTGQDIAVTGEFDIPVRFDVDNFDVNIVTFDAGSIPSLPLAEVRGE